MCGINRTGESVLIIEKKVWTSWRGIGYVIVRDAKHIQGRTKMIEDGIMDKVKDNSKVTEQT